MAKTGVKFKSLHNLLAAVQLKCMVTMSHLCFGLTALIRKHDNIMNAVRYNLKMNLKS